MWASDQHRSLGPTRDMAREHLPQAIHTHQHPAFQTFPAPMASGASAQTTELVLVRACGLPKLSLDRATPVPQEHYPLHRGLEWPLTPQLAPVPARFSAGRVNKLPYDPASSPASPGKGSPGRVCTELLWGPQSGVPGRANICPQQDKQGSGRGAGYRVVGVVALVLGKVQPNHPWTEVSGQEHWVCGQRGSGPGAHVGKHRRVYWSSVQEFTSVYNVPYRAGFVQSQPAVCGDGHALVTLGA